jgi:hypothetical protein
LKNCSKIEKFRKFKIQENRSIKLETGGKNQENLKNRKKREEGTEASVGGKKLLETNLGQAHRRGGVRIARSLPQ